VVLWQFGMVLEVCVYNRLSLERKSENRYVYLVKYIHQYIEVMPSLGRETSCLPKNRRNTMQGQLNQWLFERSRHPLAQSYLSLRKGVGFIGVLLPILLIFGESVLKHCLWPFCTW